MPLTKRVDCHFYLDPDVEAGLRELVHRRGGRAMTSLSTEVNRALRLYIRHEKGEDEDSLMAPVFQRLMDEKFAQLEAWLRPGVWGGATYAATATLALLELLCGMTVNPSEAQSHLELIRGRAWRMVRREPAIEEGR